MKFPSEPRIQFIYIDLALILVVPMGSTDQGSYIFQSFNFLILTNVFPLVKYLMQVWQSTGEREEKKNPCCGKFELPADL